MYFLASKVDFTEMLIMLSIQQFPRATAAATARCVFVSNNKLACLTNTDLQLGL